ncbi:MAG: hypothetical protein ACUVQP_06385 [Bacteroidales bacterium]
MQNFILFNRFYRLFISLIEQLKKDLRYNEGMKACINCGVCTVIYPAAQYYDYDPRMIVNIVQRKQEDKLM